ncbi:hypothetical protein [Enterococcus sp. HY326]|uniref:hypothetical protein n=1 Tax=Enterococcus sp. HY326 TaxID=2971265 RepID=UPI00223F2681|nr:hypothetical protein [Enterococcus sp. HY326]
MIHLKDVQAALAGGGKQANLHSEKGSYTLRFGEDANTVEVLSPEGEVIDTFHGNYALENAEDVLNHKNQSGAADFITTLINDYEAQRWQ